jgi:very-short-patch-repair endonuclease
MSVSSLEALLDLHIRAAQLPKPVQELKFHPIRRWRFDRAWPDKMVALEIDGGVWTNGRHSRGVGYTNDCRKLNEAVLLGWRVLRVTGPMVKSGEALDSLIKILTNNGITK